MERRKKKMTMMAVQGENKVYGRGFLESCSGR